MVAYFLCSLPMDIVIIESPYGNVDPDLIERNVQYARACMKDALERGEAPYASHLLYTQPGVLDDSLPAERLRGIEAGFAFRRFARRTAFYVDLGWSQGMTLALEHCRAKSFPMTFRTLTGWTDGHRETID